MTAFAKSDPPSDSILEIRRATELLGGKKVFADTLEDALDVHEMLLRGLPLMALTHFMDTLSVIRKTAFLEMASE